MANSQASSYYTYMHQHHVTDNHSSSWKHFLPLGSCTLNSPDFLLNHWLLSMADSFSSSQILNIRLPQVTVMKTCVFYLCATFQDDNFIWSHSFNARCRLVIPNFACPAWTAPHTSSLISISSCL